MTVTLAKWSIEEYHQMIEAGVLEGRQVELLNGDIVEMVPEGIPHAYLSTKAADYIRSLLKDRVEVREGKPITLQNNSEPEPDVAIIQPLDDEYGQHHPYPENIFWLIEFANASLSKDLELKTQVYASAGIPEYWVVNLRKMELIVFTQPLDQSYASRQVFTDGEVHPVSFPDVAVSVARILRNQK
ncbi:MAG TPA: Uma2 family endonuclease [Trichocoleus sp.]